jgi:hypothetical protein
VSGGSASVTTLTTSGNATLGSGAGNEHTVNGSSTQSAGARFGTAQTGGGSDIGGNSIELAAATTVDTATFIDFHARAGSDFDARIIRFQGVNGALDIRNEGTGGMSIFTNGINRRFTNGNGYVFSTIPGGSTLYPDFACRAWVNFNGANGAIRGSGNISSVTRNANGDYTVNLASALPDVNYATLVTGTDNPVNTGTDLQAANLYGGGVYSTTQVRIQLKADNAGAGVDGAIMSLSIFR